MTAEKRLYTAELRAGREPALSRLREALREAGGRPRSAAAALDVSVQTLYYARAVQPLVRAVWDECVTPQPEAARAAQIRRHRR